MKLSIHYTLQCHVLLSRRPCTDFHFVVDIGGDWKTICWWKDADSCSIIVRIDLSGNLNLLCRPKDPQGKLIGTFVHYESAYCLSSCHFMWMGRTFCFNRYGISVCEWSSGTNIWVLFVYHTTTCVQWGLLKHTINKENSIHHNELLIAQFC